MNINNKKGPGEHDDDDSAQGSRIPTFVATENLSPPEIRAQQNDCDSFPGIFGELHDPAKHTVLIRFGTFLKGIRESGRSIDQDEQQALSRIREKLEALLADCQRLNKQDWADYVAKRIAYIVTLLEFRSR